MFLHHLATVGLITFSYVNNMVRVGTLVMCLHDASDFLLEAAKLANYAKFQRLCDSLFVMFGFVFVSSRLGIYPFWILNTTLFESWEIIGPYPSWWVFNVLLLLLQVLHAIWSYLILRIAYKAVVKGKVSKDDRSDIESSSDEEDALTNGTKLHHHSPFKGTTNANGTNGHLTTGTWVGDHYMASSRTMCNVGEVQKGQPWWKTSQHWTFLFLKDRYIKNSMLLHGIWAHLSAR